MFNLSKPTLRECLNVFPYWVGNRDRTAERITYCLLLSETFSRNGTFPQLSFQEISFSRIYGDRCLDQNRVQTCDPKIVQNRHTLKIE